MSSRVFVLVAATALTSSACADSEPSVAFPTPIELATAAPATTTPEPSASQPPQATSGSSDDADTEPATGFEGRVDLDPTGNRVSTGRGDLTSEPLIVELGSPVTWVVPTSDARDTTWIASLADGRVLEVDLVAGTTRLISDGWDGSVFHVVDDVLVVDEPLALNPAALADSRIVRAGDHIAYLSDPTDAYGHGVLGDRIEAGSVTVESVDGAGQRNVFGPTDPEVIEGISPMFVDADGDGVEEILVTHANAETGARLVLWSVDGEIIAESQPIGRGNRWRNQLGAAAFGPNGEIEIVDVRTPHIGGTLQWFRLVDSELVRVASQTGFTSHEIGSRNLDLAIIADPDGDGRLEVVAPTNERIELGVVARVGDNATEIEARVPLPSQLESNLAAVDHPDGTASYAAGTATGQLVLWLAP